MLENLYEDKICIFCDAVADYDAKFCEACGEYKGLRPISEIR